MSETRENNRNGRVFLILGQSLIVSAVIISIGILVSGFITVRRAMPPAAAGAASELLVQR